MAEIAIGKGGKVGRHAPSWPSRPIVQLPLILLALLRSPPDAEPDNAGQAGDGDD